MPFERIWSKFEWILDEMRDGGLFEAYIPSLENMSVRDFSTALEELADQALSYSLDSNVWSDNTSENDWNKEYTLSEYAELFYSKKIIVLDLVYVFRVKGIEIAQKLMFEPNGDFTSLNIIVYRDAILEAEDPKDTVRLAILEHKKLQELFSGDSLFLIGQYAENYPNSKSDNPDEWLRIA